MNEKEKLEKILDDMMEKLNITDKSRVSSFELISKHKELSKEISTNPISVLYDDNNKYHDELMAIVSLAIAEGESFKVAERYISLKGSKILMFLHSMGEDASIVNNILAKNITLYFKPGIRNRTLYNNIYRMIDGNEVTYGATDVCIQLFPENPLKFEELCNLIMKSN